MSYFEYKYVKKTIDAPPRTDIYKDGKYVASYVKDNCMYRKPKENVDLYVGNACILKFSCIPKAKAFIEGL